MSQTGVRSTGSQRQARIMSDWLRRSAAVAAEPVTKLEGTGGIGPSIAARRPPIGTDKTGTRIKPR
jgi:hypothetical protein